MDGVVNMDRFALGQEFKNHPEYWTPPTRASVLQTQLQNLNKSREQITAYYLEPIFKITPKFDIAPGVRLENTRAWGSGASSLTDPLTRLALTGSKTGVVDTTSDAYIITRYSPKAGYTNPYDTWLKYLHASYRFTKNLTGRLSYNDSVTRPDLNRMVTGITINNDTAIPPTATVNNTDLKPERARNMSAGLDYYTRQAGYFTMFFARHDMMDKIVTDTVDIDPGGSYLGDPQWGGWRISTAHNVTKSHSSSLELTYQTPQLDFLPSYLRGLSLYTNYSENYYDNYENYRRPRMGANGRLYYRLGRFAANWNTSWVPTYRNSAYSATGVATFNTYRITHDVGASFQLRRNLSLTFTGRNVLNAETGGKTFSNRPDIIQRWIYTGSVWKVGLSGNF
jgi:outer membrane receptor protein involved in Fe transport